MSELGGRSRWVFGVTQVLPILINAFFLVRLQRRSGVERIYPHDVRDVVVRYVFIASIQLMGASMLATGERF
jgi:hypothetical protein